jgi:hypothetical protein
MLLKQIHKNTEKSHPDYEGLNEIYEKFLHINKENNEKMDKHAIQRTLEKF